MPGGAVDVIAEGWLDGVQSIYGLHCDPKLACGQVGLRAGSLTSASDAFIIELQGPGGHTARPEQTVDLIRWSGRLAADLAAVIAQTTSECTVVLGMMHAGLAPNVIPAMASMAGTFRTSDLEVWKRGEHIVADAIATILDGPGAPQWTLTYTVGIPPVVNDADAVALVRDALRGVPIDVVDAVQSRGGDSFAWYLERVPGMYVRLGTHDPTDDGARLDLHSAHFDVDERAIAIGSQVLVAIALAGVAQLGA